MGFRRPSSKGCDLAGSLRSLARLRSQRFARRATGLAGLVAFAWALSLPQAPAKDTNPEFSPKEFQESVRYLASDKLKGRGDGTPELNRAAAFIAKRFRKSHLLPAGDHDTYFQHFMMTVGAKLGRNKLRHTPKRRHPARPPGRKGLYSLQLLGGCRGRSSAGLRGVRHHGDGPPVRRLQGS